MDKEESCEISNSYSGEPNSASNAYSKNSDRPSQQEAIFTVPISESRNSLDSLPTLDSESNFHFRSRKKSRLDSSFKKKRTLTKYGSELEPPRDDSVFYVTDDDFGIFASGRDYEPIYVTHKYTREEKVTLSSFDSLDYLPPHSEVYKHWVRRQKESRLHFDRWLMMGFIGFVVGVIGFLLHQVIEEIGGHKWRITKQLMTDQSLVVAWTFCTSYSVLFVLFSASLIVFWRPSASGSGIPEVTGFLNGTHIRHIFNLQTLIAKFLSCVAAIGAGMPVGPEGPMVHLGALVGAGVSQVRSETLGFQLPFFENFRNSEDRRNFISAGAAAGIASAFGAPVGGLLFSMEDLSSYWTTNLSWQIFFCCIIATFTSDLFNSAFKGFQYTGNFGQFKTERYILFNIDQSVDVNVVMIIPTILIGIFGGTLGALFTIINLKVARVRKRVLSLLSAKWKQSCLRLAEPSFIMIVVSTLSLLLPAAFTCTPYTCIKSATVSQDCLSSTTAISYNVTEAYRCQKNDTMANNSSYNEMASLLFGTTENAVKQLFSRKSHFLFDFPSLSTGLLFYFFFVVWASGTSIASGILVPMLLIGSLYGRMVGLVMVTMFGVNLDENSYWKWMDPGAFALIGAASFFGGVTRLTMAVTVIMMELTNDVQALLPVMMAVVVSKWVGDFFTHPVFHAQLEMKCIPFLEQEPRVTVMGKSLKLELFAVCNVMTSPVVTIQEKEIVQVLAECLLNTPHGGFPVVRKDYAGYSVFTGLITRLELTVLLRKTFLFIDGDPDEEADVGSHHINWVEYQELLIEKISDPEHLTELLLRYAQQDEYKNKYLDLRPYVNRSALSIPEKFSLHRTYVIFRTLGMRHLTVVDDRNQVIGIVTRKDLMGFKLVEKLGHCLKEEIRYGEEETTQQNSNGAASAL